MSNSGCTAAADDVVAAHCATSGSKTNCDTTADATSAPAPVTASVTGTGTEPSIASKSLATTASNSLIVPVTTLTTGIDAATIVVADVLAPVIKKWTEFSGKIQSLKDVSFIENNIKLKNETELEANKIVLKNLLEKFMEDNKDKTDTSLLTKDLNNLKAAIDEILNPPKQTGGKKIISRTHKSINQFLNPKITAANIKSKRFRNTKSKSKSKKRTRY